MRVNNFSKAIRYDDLDSRKRSSMRSAFTALVLGLAFVSCSSQSTPPPTPIHTSSFTDFPFPSHEGGATAIIAGSDGALWFESEALSYGDIGRISRSGAYTLYPNAIPFDAYARSFVLGPDGAIWFDDVGSASTPTIRRLSTSGVITSFSLPQQTSAGALASGPDGAIWYTGNGFVGRLTTAGAVTQFPLPSLVGNLEAITAGPDGALWLSQYSLSSSQASQVSTAAIVRMTTTGASINFPLPPGVAAQSIVTGPDSALWFCELYTGNIGRITTAGALRRYPLPIAGTLAQNIALGPDGALWFAETVPGTPTTIGKVGRITTAGAITEYVIPGSQNVFGVTAGPDGALWIAAGDIWRLTP